MNIATQAIEKANVPATQAEIGSYAAACPDRKALVRYPVMGINTKPLKKRIQMIISIIVPYMGDINSPPFPVYGFTQKFPLDEEACSP